MRPKLIRFYEPEGWLTSLFSSAAAASRDSPFVVRIAKVPNRFPYITAWSISLTAGFESANTVHELLWFCGAQTGENAAEIERLFEERRAYLESKLAGIGFAIEPGRFMTELEAAV